MEKPVYELLDGEKLLTRESWLWMSINDGKKDDEPHTVFVELREIEDPSGDIKDLFKQCIEWMREYRGQYNSIEIEKVSFHRGCGEFDHKTYLVGRRKETAEEVNQRLLKLSEEKKLSKEREDAKNKVKEDKEKAEYLKLKQKFEGR